MEKATFGIGEQERSVHEVAFSMSSSLRPRSTRTVAAVAVLALSVAGLAGCVSRESATASSDAPALVSNDQLSTVTLDVGDQKGGTEALLRASGELEGTPYAVAFSTFTSGPPQVEAATAGQIDFAVTGNTPPVFGVAANARIKVVSAYTNDASGDQILVPPTSTGRPAAGRWATSMPASSIACSSRVLRRPSWSATTWSPG